VVFGDINGQLQLLAKKLAAVNAKGDFSFALISGDLFAEDDDTVTALLEEKIQFALPTYFTVGKAPLPQRIIDKLLKDEDVC
jgi:hypothetical protein